MSTKTTNFVMADYSHADHAKDLVTLLDGYANDPMGGSEPLSDFCKDNLVAALANTPGAFSVLGYQGDTPVALANCFRSLSTFACRPLINIHDLAVSQQARGQGLSQQLLAFIEREARASRCCKITLEVLSGNAAACAAYEKFGFENYQLDDEHGGALFMHKPLVE
ncbi:MAG: GNAT family N-acetyltransferase [Gammaproteobacteria bacterium]|nr:GNAT family N-acetyltransferase [Gammaproteobacteria bacterium]